MNQGPLMSHRSVSWHITALCIVYWSGAVPSSADTQRVVRGGGLGYPPRTHGVPAGEGCGGG